ncbi:MAG: YkgJ family cysteine cluster protein, partial [Candidatus Lokiarchaeota archaeon]|nr:YkgJ family cysteine cluster protein [Candidatus Lokiarchaeota archaeon]
MSEKKLISLVQKYNYLMGQAIQGPNCVDPTICLGDCCSIRIDVPKKLAEEYIKRKYAKETDFIRSNIFTFQLRFNESTTKCFLFDKSINGCSVHDSGIKPPQCWIYPTGFSSEDKIPIKCKKASGWFIMDKEKAQKAKKLLDEYINLCKIEAEEEKEKIVERIQQNSLLNLIKTIAPSHLG